MLTIKVVNKHPHVHNNHSLKPQNPILWFMTHTSHVFPPSMSAPGRIVGMWKPETLTDPEQLRLRQGKCDPWLQAESPSLESQLSRNLEFFFWGGTTDPFPSTWDGIKILSWIPHLASTVGILISTCRYTCTSSRTNSEQLYSLVRVSSS